MKKFVLILLVLCEIDIYAQYGNNWTSPWQNLIDFNTEPPTIKNCKARTRWDSYSLSSIITASDSLGRLTLYNSSDTLYNSKHQIIKNGTGIKMYSPICIPINGGKQYIIVHSNYWDQTILLYTVVNMEADSGNGEVTQKNIWLWKMHDEFSGRKTYTKREGGGFWLITRGRTNIYAFPVIDTVIQNPTITNDFDTTLYNTNGFTFTMSNDGKTAIRDRILYPHWPNTDNPISQIIVYDFDNTSGTFSKQQMVLSRSNGYTELGIPDSKKQYSFPDIIFSPNDSLIYILLKDVRINEDSILLYQLERYSNKKEKSKKNIYYNFNWNPEEMRLGPNGKIYVSFWDNGNVVKNGISTLFYGAILNPDNIGNKCNFYQKHIPFLINNWDGQGNIATEPGLPNILFEYLKVKYTYDINCGGNAILYNVSDTSKFACYTWYFGDGDSLYNSTFLPFVRHKYSKPNKYFLKLKATNKLGYSAWYSDSVLIDSSMISPIAGYKTKGSIGCQWNRYEFIDNSQSLYNTDNYTWYYDFGDSTDTVINSKSINIAIVSHLYNKTGKYTAKLIFTNAYCSDTFVDTQHIFIKPAPHPGLSLTPNNGCIPQVFQIKPLYYDTIVGENYFIYNSSTSLNDSFIYKPTQPATAKGFNLNQKDSGLYTIKQLLRGTTGCITQDSINIQLNSRPLLKLVNDTFICSDELLQLTANEGYQYKWSTGDTAQAIMINKAGIYWVKETNGGCMVEDTVLITQDFDEHCKFNISVYPNPFGNDFNIAVYSRIIQNINIQLFETSGKQVASYSNVPVNQFTTYSVNTNNMASAMYVLHITTNDKKFTYKLVKLGE